MREQIRNRRWKETNRPLLAAYAERRHGQYVAANPPQMDKSCARCSKLFRAEGRGRTRRQFCDECQRHRHNERTREHKDRNRKRIRAEARAYARKRYATDSDHAERQRAYMRARDPLRVSVINQRSYAKHAEKRRAARLRYREENREAEIAYARSWYRKTRPERLAAAEEYRRLHPERARAATQAWAKKNPTKRREYDNARRARLAGAAGRFTAEEFKLVCESQEHRCFYCGGRLPLTADHVVPLKAGGSNTILNVVAACRPCNSAKGDRPFAAFLGGRWLQSRVA